MKSPDIQYMQRALELAQLGRGSVSPNPMVGCVIVHNDTIIGEGWHRLYGEGHAEVNAVNAVTDKALLKESTCYVTLEPCSHYGKTPPCADMLASHDIQRVVVAVKDSNPLVGGKGIARLKAAGIDVDYGVLESEARALNARFFTSIEKNRPYIVLKWAQTTDGFVARTNFDSKWISGPDSRLQVHQWRGEEDAIMVGTNTARYDNPRLNVRGVTGKDPLRVVIDKRLELDTSLNLFDGSQKTVCYNLLEDRKEGSTAWVEVREDQLIADIMNDLHARKIQSVFVEGGSQLLNSLMTHGFWDEARVFESNAVFGEGIAAPQIDLAASKSSEVGTDTLKIYHNPEPK